MNLPHELAWLTKVVLTATAALLLCAVITPIIARPEIQASEDADAAPALTAYRNEPTPRYLIVGTSLARRLKPEFFLPFKVSNLASLGRSSMTELEIAASYPKLPSNIFVEINMMLWGADEDFVKKFSYNSGPLFQIAPPLRSLIAYLEAPDGKAKQPSRVDESLLSKPPTEYDNNIYIERARKEWNGRSQDALIASNIDAFSRLVKTLEARGSRVYLFELPLAPSMAETHVATTTRILLHQRFTDPVQWVALNYPIAEMRFGDHAHLDERSALIVARAMRDAMMLKTFNNSEN